MIGWGPKECTHCGEIKPAAMFSPREKGGSQSWCRRCRNDHIKLKWAPAKGKERKLAIIKLKGGKCAMCHGVFPHYVFDLHHRDPTSKEIRLSGLQDKSWARIEREVAKCDLLCSNCHRITHHAATHPESNPSRCDNPRARND